MSFTPDRTARIAKRKTRIDEGVASGRLTQEQGQKRIANMEKRNQRTERLGTEMRGLYEKGRSAAQKFGKGKLFDQISEGAVAKYKQMGTNQPRISERVREDNQYEDDGSPGFSGDVFNREKSGQGNSSYNPTTGGGYLDNMDMVDSVTGNYFAQHPTEEAGYYAPPEDDPNETKFTGAGPSNTQARDANWNNSFINPTTGSYYDDEAARAAFAKPYYPTTKSSGGNVTTPGKLTDEDIQQLNKYQMNLENKQKTKGLSQKEADQLNDYYRREEYYRTRGGYEDEPDDERNKTATAIDKKTGLSVGAKPPAAPKAGAGPKMVKAEDGSMVPASYYNTTSTAGAKPGAKITTPTSGGTSKLPTKPGTTPKANPTAAGNYTGGAGGTAPPKPKDSPSVAALKSLHTAQRYPGGNEAKQVAATLKKYPGGEIARAQAAQNAAKKTTTTTPPPKNTQPVKVSNQSPPVNNSNNGKVVGNPTFVDNGGGKVTGNPTKKTVSYSTKPSPGNVSGSTPAGAKRATTGSAAKPVPTGTTKSTNYGSSKGVTYSPGHSIANAKGPQPVYSPRASDPSGKPAGVTGPTRIVQQPKAKPAANQQAAQAKQTTSGSKAYSPGYAVGNKVAAPKPVVDPSQKKKVTTVRSK